MNPLFQPYRWILLLAISASMLLLLKINKRSFYYHYFKVIEEVELRNSQALLTEALPIQFWADSLKELFRSGLSFLTTLLAIGFVLFRLLDQWILPRKYELACIPCGEAQRFLPPVRAP